jgi:hypothetical protein
MDRLWEHLCFEAFLRRDGSAQYAELNFSPSSEWAMYSFSAYREGMKPLEPKVPPAIRVRRDEGALSLDAHIDLGPEMGMYAGHPLCLALSAVVEDNAGKMTYWALAHPPGKPDFHHRDGFVLRLQGSVE